MQEEIENRTVNLAISTTKLTARGIIRLAAKGLAYIKRKSREAALKNEKPDGRQTIQQLIGQNQGVTNIDISQTDLKGFEKYARKYGVDYAITKDKSVFPPKYLVFFKARDADAMTAAFNAYSAEVLAKSKRPSALNRLHELIDAVKSIPTKVTSRDKQREQSR
ncbi:PcfB family protein [Butyricicoccus sp. AF10-3]|nr:MULTISPECIES: PcfB family protein [unclassified Butyricicoccus]RHS37017.1 PcfB family protein [Butyricicoccus sp. AF10-3]